MVTSHTEVVIGENGEIQEESFEKRWSDSQTKFLITLLKDNLAYTILLLVTIKTDMKNEVIDSMAKQLHLTGKFIY